MHSKFKSRDNRSRPVITNCCIRYGLIIHNYYQFSSYYNYYVYIATNPYPPPDNLYLADVQAGKLIFNWTSIISNNCSTLQYSITSDCGTCPNATNRTTATCSDLQLTTNARLCHFRVSSHACSLVGHPSSPIAVVLKGALISEFIQCNTFRFES